MILEKTAVLEVSVRTRVYYEKGALCISSYLKCYPREELIRLDKYSELLFTLINGNNSIGDIINLLKKNELIQSEEEIVSWYSKLLTENYLSLVNENI